MATYAMSGGATGIGAAIRKTLQTAGHKVVVVDLKDADICADLSDYAGRQRAVEGANDLGGTLMNETITRAAGASHGEEVGPAEMDARIRAMSRSPRQRNTLYGEADPAQRERAARAERLKDVVNTPASKYERSKRGLIASG